MKLTKEILKEFGYTYSKEDNTYSNEMNYIYADDIKKMSLKEFFYNEIDTAYGQGYMQAKLEIKKALGIQ